MTPLAYLIDEYPDNKATDIQLAKLTRRMKPYSNEILLTAIDLYADSNKWFPKWAELKPYIDMAAKREQMNYFAVPTDDELFAREVQAGTMRPIDTIEAEVNAAAVELGKLLEGMRG